VVAASSAEVDQALKQLHVVEVGPEKHLRMLDRNLLHENARLILDTLIANSWTLDAVKEDDIYSEIADIDRVYACHVLKCLGEPLDTRLWRLNREKIAIATADMLLRYRDDNTKVCPYHLNAMIFHLVALSIALACRRLPVDLGF
jgi:hypothetical protein